MAQLQEWWRHAGRWKRGRIDSTETYHYLHCGTFFVDVCRENPRVSEGRGPAPWTVAITSACGGYRHLEPATYDTLAAAKEHGGRLAEEILRAALVRIRLASA